MMKLRTGDQVMVVAGKDKGKKSRIAKVLPKEDKVIVEGINTYKRHLKRQSDKNPGGIVEVERAMSVAKVQLICPHCKAITRVGWQVQGTEKVRVCKKCKSAITQEKKEKGK